MKTESATDGHAGAWKAPAEGTKASAPAYAGAEASLWPKAGHPRSAYGQSGDGRGGRPKLRRQRAGSLRGVDGPGRSSRGQTRKVGSDRGFRVEFRAAVASDMIHQPRQSPVELRNLRDAAGERCVEGV